MRRLPRLRSVVAYVVMWILFGAVGLCLNFVCALMLLFPDRERYGSAVRSTISRLFSAWCGWLGSSQMVAVTWKGFEPDTLAGSAVYIANHPGLIDAPMILARLPDTICIFKPAIIRNPVLGPAAIMAGYVSGDNGIDLIRDVAGRLNHGCSLLVFPEGTRTDQSVKLNPLKPGFALIAARARVPIRIIAVRAPRDLLPRGRPVWRMPQVPATVEIELFGELSANPGESATEFAQRAGNQLSAALAS